GAQKLFGLFGGVDGAGATVPLLSQFGLAGVLEFFGGALLVLGLLTRPVALLLLLEMIVAYVQVHVPQGGLPIENGGELALLYARRVACLAGNGRGPRRFDRRLLPRLYGGASAGPLYRGAPARGHRRTGYGSGLMVMTKWAWSPTSTSLKPTLPYPCASQSTRPSNSNKPSDRPTQKWSVPE